MVSGIGMELPEILTFSPNDAQSDRWLKRTLSQAGDRQATIRDRLFALLSPQRHHVILDLNSTTGLLTWEALRQVPEGGVFTLVPRQADAIAIQEQSASLPELLRPMVTIGTLSELPEQIAAIKFDGIVGNCALMRGRDKCELIQTLANLLQPGGKIALYESITRHTQRIYRLLDFARLGISQDVGDRWIRAEDAIYANPDDPMTNWDVEDLRSWFEQVDLAVTMEVENTISPFQISSATIDRWFGQNESKPSYASHLSKFLSETEIAIVQQGIVDRLLHRTVDWQSKSVVIIAKFNGVGEAAPQGNCDR
jgi:putative ATPase